MANSVFNQDHLGTSFYFVPYAYVSQLQNRIKVTELSREQIQEAMKTVGIYEQIVILHDLMLAGRKKESKTDRDFHALAAELCVQSSNDVQSAFIMHVCGVTAILKDFATAILANHIDHKNMELKEKGSPGLTENQLAKEKHLALGLEKYRA